LPLRVPAAPSTKARGRACDGATEVPARAELLNHDARQREIALKVVEFRDALFLGRGASHPIAIEGALKRKEISHVHAEVYAAGEMKHRPIETTAAIVVPTVDLFAAPIL
jgi:glucosamine--fructose-6-phosphate aminotransferase (isomerizing)